MPSAIVCSRAATDQAVLRCGGPDGPAYQFDDENLPPPGPGPAYREGDVALDNGGRPGANGARFLVVFGPNSLPPTFPVFGHVTRGLDILRPVGNGGQPLTLKQVSLST